jgi:hypothetical protein
METRDSARSPQIWNLESQYLEPQGRRQSRGIKSMKKGNAPGMKQLAGMRLKEVMREL